MDKKIIRLQSIEINNFKNIEHGVVEYNSYRKGFYFDRTFDMIGIYGQNGSGKTSVIESLRLLQIMMSGQTMTDNLKNYVGNTDKNCTFKFIFYIKNEDEYLVDYSFTLKNSIDKVEIIAEKINIKDLSDNIKRVKTIINYDENTISIPIEPKVRYNDLIKINPENQIDLLVARKMCKKENLSLIFYDDVINMLDNPTHKLFYNIIKTLKMYSIFNLFIIETKHTASIPLNFMQISFRIEHTKNVKKGDIGINLIGKTSLDNDAYSIIAEVIEQMNVVLKNVVPGLTLSVVNLGNETNETGEILTQVEIMSKRNGLKIPLKFESEGIKKIVSVLSTLITVYNNPSICLAVDELDSGIFEFLLGELLGVIEKNGKGQMIFTSHNLRPLEKLHSESIVISTTNSKNKFIRVSNVKETSNLRNMYLRSIDLGGLQEPIYEDTNAYEIAHAFRKAGKMIE